MSLPRLNNTYAILILHFLNNAVGICSISYVNALFLSTYPTTWLSYFFMGQAIVDLGCSLLLPILAKNPFKGSVIIYIISAFFMLMFFFILRLHWHLMPFVVCLFIVTIGLLFNVITWSCTRSVLDMIELKQLSNLIISAGAIGSVFFGVMVTLLVKKYNISILLPILAGSFLVGAKIIYRLQPLPFMETAPKHGLNPYKYPLFRHIYITIFLIVISYTLTDYCLKVELGTTLSGKKIGEFMAMFIGISSVVTVLVSFLGTKLLLNRQGVIGLFSILPLYWIITGLGVFLLPSSLWIVTLMAAGKYLFYYSMFSMARELTLNVLPHQIKISAEFKLKSFASPNGGGAAAILLFLLSKYFTVATFGLLIALLNMYILFYIRKLRFAYLTTLEEAIYLKRFTLEELSQDQEKMMQDLALESLTSTDPEIIELGFLFAKNIKSATLSPIVYKNLHSPAIPIRIASIENSVKLKTVDVVPELLKLLTSENNPEIIWHLFNAIAILQPQATVVEAEKFMLHHEPLYRAGAIRLLFAGNNEIAIKKANLVLTKMLNDADPSMRIAAARVLAYQTHPHFIKELANLISDPNDNVSKEAIQAAAHFKSLELANVIIDRFQSGSLSLTVKNVLQQYGDDIIPIVVKNIPLHKRNKQLNLIEVIAAIPGQIAEQALLSLANNTDTLIRGFVAKTSAVRVRHLNNNPDLHEQSLKWAQHEINLITLLYSLANKYHSDFINQEIQSRIYLAKERLLYWLATYTRSSEVIGLIPVVLFGLKGEQAQAIELLEALLNLPMMTKQLSDLVLKKINISKKHNLNSNDYLDEWLRFIIDFNAERVSEKIMNQMQKVFVLRKIELFKHLSAETLLVIADEAEKRDMIAGEKIFDLGDPPTGLFIIVSGKVVIKKQHEILNELNPNDFFGELALLDNNTRSASAYAAADGVLLFLEKETFNRITNDLPEVLRAVVAVVLKYLRKYLIS